MTATPDAKALQGLLDRQALGELPVSYCRAIDRRDYVFLRSLYHDDAVEDRGGIFKGNPDEWIEFVKGSVSQFELTVHRLFNVFFKIDGDYAESEIYVEAYHRTAAPDAQEVIAGGRFLDRYERRNGVWKYIHRAATSDRSEMRKVDPEAYAHFVSASFAAKPDASDPSYSELKLFGRVGP
jgi:hypothetical protein